MNDAEETRLLLQRWHQGDRDAVDLLIRRDLPWIRDFVSARLGPLLRARGETQDYLQDATPAADYRVARPAAAISNSTSSRPGRHPGRWRR